MIRDKKINLSLLSHHHHKSHYHHHHHNLYFLGELGIYAIIHLD